MVLLLVVDRQPVELERRSGGVLLRLFERVLLNVSIVDELDQVRPTEDVLFALEGGLPPFEELVGLFGRVRERGGLLGLLC